MTRPAHLPGVTTHLELEHDIILFDKNDPKVSRAEEVDKIHAAAKFLSFMSADVDGVIKGHASSEGKEQFNQDLSEQRAITVRDLLQALGVVNLPLTAVGVGSKEPAVPETAKTPRRPGSTAATEPARGDHRHHEPGRDTAAAAAGDAEYLEAYRRHPRTRADVPAAAEGATPVAKAG